MSKKRVSTSETIGSDYWISFTDIMTGLLLVFILLISVLVIYVNYSNNKYANIREEKSRLEIEKRALEAQKRALENEKQALKNAINQVFVEHQNNVRYLLEEINERLKNEHIDVDVDFDNLVIHISNNTLGFDKGRYNITDYNSLNRVHKIATIFFIVFKLNNNQLKSLDTIFIEGHTDKDPFNNTDLKGNWGLSTLRAIEFWEEFTGISYRQQEELMDEHVNNQTCIDTFTNIEGCYFLNLENVNHKKLFSVSGYASARPHECTITSIGDVNKSATCRQYYQGFEPSQYSVVSDNLNRRIDIRFIPKSATIEEVKKAMSLRSVSLD